MFKLIYKEKGKSSFQVINQYRKENNIKKIGHTGTLDPLAQGLLLIATNDDTKLLPLIKNKDKEYYTTLKLGFISKTLDAEGPIEYYSNYQPSHNEVQKVLNSFVGNIKQKPPIFSAKKINGKRSYELARKNKQFELNDVDVTIYKINDVEYSYPYLSFRVKVSNGTYIRSLVNDIGLQLSSGAYMTFLERTMVNGLMINDEIDIDKMIDLNIIEIANQEHLLKFFNGQIKKIDNKTNDKYLLKFKNNIIGFIEIKDKNIIKSKLFGNRIKNILKGDKNV